MLNTLRFGIIEVYSCIVCHFQTLSTGKAGEPHKEVGRPPRGGDRRQPWVQGTSPGYKVQALGIRWNCWRKIGYKVDKIGTFCMLWLRLPRFIVWPDLSIDLNQHHKSERNSYSVHEWLCDLQDFLKEFKPLYTEEGPQKHLGLHTPTKTLFGPHNHLGQAAAKTLSKFSFANLEQFCQMLD